MKKLTHSAAARAVGASRVSSTPASAEKRKRQAHFGQVAMTARAGRRSAGSSRLKPHCGQIIFTVGSSRGGRAC